MPSLDVSTGYGNDRITLTKSTTLITPTSQMLVRIGRDGFEAGADCALGDLPEGYVGVGAIYEGAAAFAVGGGDRFIAGLGQAGAVTVFDVGVINHGRHGKHGRFAIKQIALTRRIGRTSCVFGERRDTSGADNGAYVKSPGGVKGDRDGPGTARLAFFEARR